MRVPKGKSIYIRGKRRRAGVEIPDNQIPKAFLEKNGEKWKALAKKDEAEEQELAEKQKAADAEKVKETERKRIALIEKQKSEAKKGQESAKRVDSDTHETSQPAQQPSQPQGKQTER